MTYWGAANENPQLRLPVFSASPSTLAINSEPWAVLAGQLHTDWNRAISTAHKTECCFDHPTVWKSSLTNQFSFSPAQVKSPKAEKIVGHCREWKMTRETGMLLDFFLDGSFSHVYLTLCYQDYPETDTSELVWACHQLVPASIAKLLLWPSFLHKNH